MSDNLFGFQSDEDKSLKGGVPGGKFGLNPGAKLVKFEYNANGGKDNSAANCLDIEITLGDKRFLQRHYEITKVFGKSGEITDPSSEEYKKAFVEAVKQQKGLITHYLKIFYTEEEIKAAFSTAVLNNFVDYFKFVTNAVKIGVERKGPEVDVFLQYQWNITSGQERTFLELPKNLKDGSFICKPIVGKWVEVRNADGLKYIDETNSELEHRFKRDANYLGSNKAVQQTTASQSTDMGGASTTGAAASSTNW